MKIRKIALSLVTLAMLTGCSLGAEIVSVEAFKNIYDSQIAPTKVTDVKQKAALKTTIEERTISTGEVKKDIYYASLENFEALKTPSSSKGKSITVSKAENIYNTREVISSAGVNSREDVLVSGTEIIYSIESANNILTYSEDKLIATEQEIGISITEKEKAPYFLISYSPEKEDPEVDEFILSSGGLYMNIRYEFGKYNVSFDQEPTTWFWDNSNACFYKKIYETEEATEFTKATIGISKEKKDSQVLAFPYADIKNYDVCKFYEKDSDSAIKNAPLEGNDKQFYLISKQGQDKYYLNGRTGYYTEKVNIAKEEYVTDHATKLDEFLAKTNIKEVLDALMNQYNAGLSKIEETCNANHKLEILSKASGIAYRICDEGSPINDFTISKVDEKTSLRAIKTWVIRDGLQGDDITTYTYEGY